MPIDFPRHAAALLNDQRMNALCLPLPANKI